MVEVIKQTFMEVLPDVWPMLIIITVIISSLRITYLITKHKKFLLHKEIIYLLAVIYLLCLFHVVTFQDINYGTSNFIPFKEYLITFIRDFALRFLLSKSSLILIYFLSFFIWLVQSIR